MYLLGYSATIARVKRFIILAAVSAGLWAAAQAPSGAVRFGSPAEADWRPPTNLPPGAEYHLVSEDPKTHGIQALVRFPSGYSVPSHSHSCTETLVVLSGKLMVSAGGLERTLGHGDYVVLPMGAPHVLRTAGWGKVLFTASTDGPYDLKSTLPTPQD